MSAASPSCERYGGRDGQIVQPCYLLGAKVPDEHRLIVARTEPSTRSPFYVCRFGQSVRQSHCHRVRPALGPSHDQAAGVEAAWSGSALSLASTRRRSARAGPFTTRKRPGSGQRGQVRSVPCVTSIAGPHGDAQLYER